MRASTRPARTSSLMWCEIVALDTGNWSRRRLQGHGRSPAIVSSSAMRLGIRQRLGDELELAAGQAVLSTITCSHSSMVIELFTVSTRLAANPFIEPGLPGACSAR